MRRAIQQAGEVTRRYGRELDLITQDLGLVVLEEPLVGRLREIYFGDAIVLRSDLAAEEKRELLAHAIGHHVMHAGNHLSLQGRNYSFGNYHEKQADVFAAWLLIPEAELEPLLADDVALPDLADHFRVTDELISLRLNLRNASQFAEPKTAGQEPESLDRPLTDKVS